MRMPHGIGVLVLCALVGLLPAISQEQFPVEVTVQVAPTPQAAFAWEAQATGGTVEIRRRELGRQGTGGGNGFALVASVSHPTATYTDTGLAAGKAYEYRIRRPSFVAGGTTWQETATYAAVTIDAPLTDERGGVLLVVDQTLAAPLAGELALLEQDLTGDGWRVVRLDAPQRSNGTHQALKAAIVAACAADPGIRALYLFGRLPIARSGLIAPDGHTPSRAHETDLYYADLDGAWTDTGYLSSANDGGEDENIAGDGRYDQSSLPSAVELMTGRVDLSGMQANRKNEHEHLRDYIQKSHAWRHGLRPVPYRGLKNSGYLFMEHNWMRAMFGAAATTSAAFQPALASDAHVWAVDFGHYDGWNEESYGAVDNRALFFLNFGSWKQMWARANNPMRALLCQPDWGLAVAWGSRPAFHMHHMAAGLPVGYSAMRTQNNAFNGSEYSPPGSYPFLQSYVSINLMGDPTLRMHPVPPPASLSVHAAGADAALAWTAPADADRVGFHVYRSATRLGAYARLTAAPLPASATAYLDAGRPAGGAYYQVRSVARTSVHTGTFINQSQGVFARLSAGGAGDAAPLAPTPPTVAAQDSVPTPLVLPGSDAEGAALVPIVVANPAHGQVRWNGGAAYYVSEAGFAGADALTYRLFDGVNLSPPVTAGIAVAASRPDVLLAWTFAAGNAAEPASTANHPDMQASSLVRGSACTSPSSGLNANAFHVRMAQTAAPAANAYLSWTVAPAAGRAMSLQRLVFFAAASRGDTAWSAVAQPFGLELRVSTDGFTTSQAVPFDQDGEHLSLGLDGRNSGRCYSATLAGIPALQNRSAAAAFRLYMWNTQFFSLGRSGDGATQSAADLVVLGSAGTANLPPTAAAGADRTIADGDGLPGESVALDGSASSDSDGSIASWRWLLAGRTIATGPAPTVRLADGRHAITLIVTDAAGVSAADEVVVAVRAPSTRIPPTARAGSDRTVADSDGLAGELVALDGSASSGDGAIVAWSWRRAGAEIATGPTPAVALGDGVHAIALTVTDNAGETATDTVVVTVRHPPLNLAPVARAGADLTIVDSDGLPGERVTLDGSASSDADGTIASWAWRRGLAALAAGPTPTVTLADGTHTIGLIVVDDDGTLDTDEIVITVLAPTNAAPVARAGADRTVADSDGLPGEQVVLDGSASSDSDGTIAAWVWREGGVVIATGAAPTVALDDGVHTIVLTVTDDGGMSGTATVAITVQGPANAPPTADAGPDRTVADSDGLPGESLTLDGSGSSDADGTIVSWVWREGSTTIATGGAPSLTLGDGTHSIVLTVTDDDGATATDTVVIVVGAPAVTPGDPPSAAGGGGGGCGLGGLAALLAALAGALGLGRRRPPQRP